MIHRGVLLPVEGGFEVFLRDLKPRDLDVQAPEPHDLLTTRQRRAFAHELAHTHYYRASDGVPLPTGEITNPMELEKICDDAAGRLLVPANLLRKEIKSKLRDSEQIDAAFIRAMTVSFHASYEVMINRISVLESQSASPRCILLIREDGGEAKVTAWYFGASILSALSPPKKRYQPMLNWLSEIPKDLLSSRGIAEREITRQGRSLLIQKFPLARMGDFLLQVDDLAHRGPSSGLPWQS